MNKRCRTCLSGERKLHILVGTLRDLISKLVPEISENELLICWECRANIRHMYLFCKKAQHSQQVFHDYSLKGSTPRFQQSQQVFHDYSLKGSTPRYSSIESKSSLGMTLTEIYSVSETNYDDNTDYTLNSPEISIKEEPTEKVFLNCDNEFHGSNLKASEETEYSNGEKKYMDMTLNLIEIPIKEESTEKSNLDCKNEYSIINYHLDHDYLSTALKTSIKSESTSKDDCGSKTDTSEIKTIQNPVKKRVRKEHDSYTCKVCGKVFDTRGKLHYHGAVHKTRPQCEECGKTLSSTNALWKHNNLMHSDTKKFTCELCKGIFFTEAGYQAHTSNPGLCRDETYCSPCGIFFTTYKTLRTHQQTSLKHFDPDTWIHSCTECDRKFPSAKILTYHHKSFHAEKKCCCTQCPKKYCTARALRDHVKQRHNKASKPKDKVCEFCGKGFKTLQILKAHRHTHTGERPYCCSLCSARFAQSGALHTHKRLVHQRVKRRRANASKS